MRKHNKPGIKIMIVLIASEFILFPPSLLRAEGYLPESAFQKRLNEKIQEGYAVPTFVSNNWRMEELVNKGNQKLELLNYTYKATPDSQKGILAAKDTIKENADNFRKAAAEQRQRLEQTAAAETEFNYIPYSDGKVVYIKNGLPSRIMNERVSDEFGNLSLKNTYNMQYNDKRLLINYRADLKDPLGNISHIDWYGAVYSADSVSYGDTDTNANRNLLEYTIRETDSAGNVRTTHWYNAVYEGKILRAFSQTIEDSVYGNISFSRSNLTGGENPDSYHEEGIGADGLYYSLDRTNISYNDKDQICSYREESRVTQLDGSKVKTIAEAKFNYIYNANQFGKDVEEEKTPDKLLESIITTTIINSDGSERTETTTTAYEYSGEKLVGASGHSEMSGRQESWWEYTDKEGHILSRGKDKNGNIIYSYIDPDTRETIVVPEDKVITTLKEGETFTSSADIQYEVLYGKPMISQQNSLTIYYTLDGIDITRTEVSQINYTNGLINNMQRLLIAQEYTQTKSHQTDVNGSIQEIVGTKDVATCYIYAENGNLQAAQGNGTSSGFEYTERGLMYYTGEITVDYAIILGEAKEVQFRDNRDYISGVEKEIQDREKEVIEQKTGGSE